MKDQIVKIIADYLNKMEVPKEKWDGTVGFFPAEWPLPTCTIADEIAEKLAAAIAPHMESGDGKNKAISVGQKVRIIALLDHGWQDGHCLPIGHVATVQEIDTNDSDLTYRLNGYNEWVSIGEIEVVE